MIEQLLKRAAEFFGQWPGVLSALKGLGLAVVTLLAIWMLYRIVTRNLRKYLLARAHSPEDVQNFMLIWRYAWLGAAVVLALIGLSGSIAGLGISAAFLGMILGWSLQAPVTGIAGWLMIMLKRPFRIGDRIIIAGIVGDVQDITLTHVVLNQVGGTVGGEEKSGRGVLVPNATLFQQVIYNYNFQDKYILDEVPVLVTYESDFDEAERIVLRAAREVTGSIVDETRQEPFIRAELADSGIRIRLRYQALAMQRQRISSEIVRAVIRDFNKNPKVEFCYPHTEILYRAKEERRDGTSATSGEGAPKPKTGPTSPPISDQGQ